MNDDDEMGARSNDEPSNCVGAAAGAAGWFAGVLPARVTTGETRPRAGGAAVFALGGLEATTGELGTVATSGRDCRPMKTGDVPEDEGTG